MKASSQIACKISPSLYTNLIVSISEDIEELSDGPSVAQLAEAVRHLVLEQGGLVFEASLHLSCTIVAILKQSTCCLYQLHKLQMLTFSS